jgi:tRNA(Ile)-lysidine synthase
MQRFWDQDGVRFLRPFLGVTRADLRAYLDRHGVGWIDDPSNSNDRYTRVKARKALAMLQPLGITADALGTVIANLAAAREAVLAATQAAADRLCHEAAGEVVFDRTQWPDLGDEVQRRLLIAALRWVSGAGYAPRGASVARAIEAVAQGRDTTLAGCRIRVSGTQFRVVREPKAVAGLVAQPGALWDGRWQVEGPFAPGYELRPLGADGLRQCKGWQDCGHSRDSLSVSPAVWYGETLIAAPVAEFNTVFRARIVAPFIHFVLSH